ncbi:glycosyltransferase [Candidatus Gracilibacteria bacterium]|nr:glycosyltransferase [Candidatus Gracilibacteria bacterium]
MLTNKKLYITYVGRLEKEKGIEIVLSCIKKSLEENRNIIWNICGDGSYKKQFDSIDHPNVIVHGYINKDQLQSILKETNLVLMPSLFLETFGLVALETLSLGVPVCGFNKGGLKDFIHPDLVLDLLDSVNSFFKIVDTGTFPMVDITAFSYEKWMETLTKLTEGAQKILVVNDYIGQVGGAEEYVDGLTRALTSLGKVVEIYGYRGKINRFIRIFLMIISPFAFWRGKNMEKKIQDFQPDLIWMHSILRYIGPFGINKIVEYKSKKYISYHDLGLICARPSAIYSESDIPMNPDLASWIPKKVSIISILSILPKWLYIRWIWYFLSKNTSISHIIPSPWMKSIFQKYCLSDPIVYPHTTSINNQVKL